MDSAGKRFGYEQNSLFFFLCVSGSFMEYDQSIGFFSSLDFVIFFPIFKMCLVYVGVHIIREDAKS